MRRSLLLRAACVLVLAPAPFAQVSFAPAVPIGPVTVAGPLASGDVDGDGDRDLVSGADAAASWLENLAGDAGSWSAHAISAAEPLLADLALADLDGDGDLDLATAGDDLAWHASGAGGSTWTRAALATGAGALALEAADVDRDGALDLVVATGAGLAWWSNRGSGFAAIPIAAPDPVSALAVADLDRDGSPDVVALSNAAGTARVLRNAAGDGSAWTPVAVTAALAGASAVAVADLDRDGDPDVVAGGGADLAWYENTAGDASAFAPRPLPGALAGVTALSALDLDLDGDPDLLAGVPGRRLVWLEDYSGVGAAFAERPIALGGAAPEHAIAADLDRDGVPDVVGASTSAGALAWREGVLPAVAPALPVDRAIVSDATEFTIACASADVDGDGDVDVISSAFLGDQVAWHENVLGDGTSWVARVVSDTADGANGIVGADVDGDGDLDIVATTRFDDRVTWYENTAGDGSLFAPHVVTDTADGARAVAAADVDRDGDTDLVVGARLSHRVSWYENATGDGSAFAHHLVSGDALRVGAVATADLDGDGDEDLLSASADDDKIAWYENAGGGTGFAEHAITLTADGASAVAASDLDGDGDADVLGANFLDDEVAWYENVAGDGSTWTARSVSTDLSGAVSVFPADLDRDGDQDVLAAWLLSDAVAWHENTDGLGSTWLTHEITTSALGAHFVVAADVDGDGWTDSISSSRSDDTVAWYPARSLVARRSALSLAGGGTQVLTLEAGTGAAGWFAWVLGSVTGTSPGLTLGGAHLPLNPDFWFGFTLTKPFAGVFGGFLAPLDANGTGTATFSLPAGLDPNLAGVVFHHAFVASAAFGDVDFASTPVRLELLP